MEAVALTVSLQAPGSLRAGAVARWELRLTNRSGEAVTLTFPSTQPGDLVLEREGVERYRWSEGRVFAQMIEARSLAPGEEWTLALQGRLEVEPGRYEAVGTVACRPPPPAARSAVVVGAAGTA